MGGVFGLNPRSADEFKRDPSEQASFYPSSFSYKQSAPCMTGFRDLVVEVPYAGDKKILVLCTSKFLLPCLNGNLFNTGHQSTEMLLPMYHFDKCGFKFDIATADGGAVALEEWTFGMATGYEDKLREMQTNLEDQLEKPMKFVDVPVDLESYAAVFLPGGHGPLIEQHTHESLGALLRSANAKALPTITLCHGPSALRAAALGGEFPYKDYKIVVFPDKIDKMSPKFGYLPGYLGEENLCEAKLKALGCNVQNKGMDDSTCVDRELITGASQLASQKLSMVAAKVLAEKYGFKVE